MPAGKKNKNNPNSRKMGCFVKCHKIKNMLIVHSFFYLYLMTKVQRKNIFNVFTDQQILF